MPQKKPPQSRRAGFTDPTVADKNKLRHQLRLQQRIFTRQNRGYIKVYDEHGVMVNIKKDPDDIS